MELPEACIIGFGGSNATPFGTPFEQTEQDIESYLSALHDRAPKGAKVIVLAHAPPKNTKCDAIKGGIHVGSEGLRRYIEAKKPDLVLCSHIHESGGQEDAIGKTMIFNLGRLSDGRAYVLTVDDAIDIRQYAGG
jgi:Icc-related predicted phosphoesterase